MRQRGELTARIAGLLALALLPLGACQPGSAPAPGPGPVVLVTLDTLPADRIGSYGSPTARTPFLDRLARRGIQVRDAIAPTPLTLPSHATVMTGLDPPVHGVRENGIFRLDESFETVAEMLPGSVESAAFVASFPVTERFNLGQGFDLFDDDLGRADRPGSPPERTADEVFRAAGDWLAARTAERAFVWAHAFDPHYPYTPPAPWPRAARATRGDGYDGEVAFVDHALGRFLQRIGALADPAQATVVLAADHGESLGRHGEITHSLFVYDATQRVPLLVAGSGILPALENRQRALIDVAPTLLDLFELPPAEAHAGASLFEAPADDIAYVETKHTELLRGWSPLHGLRTTRWKYVRAPRPELYDLEADPGETRNLHDEIPETAQRFEALLADILAADQGESEGQLSMDDEAAERLRALGYVASIEPGTEADLRKDPKDGVEGAAALFRGEEAFVAGRLLVAQRHLERALELDPENKDAHAFLSGTLVGLYDYSAAAEHARRALELPPHLNEAPLHGTLGEALLMLGKADEALPHLRIAREARPRDQKIAQLLERAEARAQ